MTGARMSKGEATRQRLLDAAQRSILEKGFTATSIDELIAECGLTKGGFFYHFKDKNDLAKALLRRYIAEDEEVYDRIFGQARDLVDDPLQVFLLGLKLLADVMGDMPNGHPGCMVAVSTYYERMFDRELREINTEAALQWRRRFRGMLDEIGTRYRPREPVDLDELADLVSTVLEGGIVMAKALHDAASLKRQILTFRVLVKALFVPLPESASPPFPAA
jgi:TetR/AcrR family transcriptional regulator, transcriptional repressor for nem operon